MVTLLSSLNIQSRVSRASPSTGQSVCGTRQNIIYSTGTLLREKQNARQVVGRCSDALTVDLKSEASGKPGHDEPLARGLEGKFVLPAERVEELKAEFQMTTDELLKALIMPASTKARPPISSFHVGAVGIGGSGALYVGCNLEFARLPLYNSVHAEQFLLVNALHHGETEIQKLAISAAPCGHCRQFFSELACADSIKFLFFGGSYSLGQLLPMRFKPTDLLEDSKAPLLLLPQENKVEFTKESLEQIQRWKDSGDDLLVNAADQALKECINAYSPYSRCPAGAAIVTEEGGVYSGGYIESAAYNPSMLPLQSAIIDAVIDGMPCYTTMTHAVIVEIDGGAVQHRRTMEINMGQIAPDATLYNLPVQWAT